MESPAIRILDDNVVNQIAAGEVVERPVSVVKELVENAIDAHADQITVSLTNGGKSLLEVIDNGVGMGKHDALLAVERFGTSKVRSLDDLQSISTHGFRGEALPSIASVSRFQLSTMRAMQASKEGSDSAGDDAGVEISIAGGKLRDVVEKQMAPGTRVRVRSLFFNVPARKKFLRAENTETGLVKSLLIDFAAAYPAIRFRLIVDGSESVLYPAVGNFSERIKQLKLVRGKSVQINSSTVLSNGVSLQVEGLLTHPIESVSSSARLRVLVNKRSVRDRLLLKAVRDGFGFFLKSGRYPAGVVHVMLPSTEVDVNVHPQKTEVRFREPGLVFAAVSEAVSLALGDVSSDMLRQDTGRVSNTSNSSFSSVIQQSAFRPQSVDFKPSRLPAEGEPQFFVEGSNSGTGEVPSEPYQEVRVPFESYTSEQGESNSDTELVSEVAQEIPTETTSSAFKSISSSLLLSSMRYVGQVFKLYLILEGDGEFAIVDMHAAHERVMFYRIKRKLMDGVLPAQMLLLPEVVPIPADRLSQLERFSPILEKLGIDYERLDGDEIMVRSLPTLLKNKSARSIFDDLLSLPSWSNWQSEIDHRWDEIVSRLACHSSVRSGRELKKEEVYSLLQELEEVERSAFCPHGRPVAKFVAESELEALFGRIM